MDLMANMMADAWDGFVDVYVVGGGRVNEAIPFTKNNNADNSRYCLLLSQYLQTNPVPHPQMLFASGFYNLYLLHCVRASRVPHFPSFAPNKPRKYPLSP